MAACTASRTWLGALLVSASAAALGCAAVNFRGRDVRIEAHGFRFRDNESQYLVGVPEIAAAASLPLVVYVEGDGGACQEFSASLWERFLVRFTGDYLLVRPRTYVNAVCGTAAFEQADYAHRVDELEVVVSDARARYPGRRVYLLGSSAGAHVSLQLAERQPALVAGIVDLGGGVRSLSEVLPEIQREKTRRGDLSPVERDAALEWLGRQAADVAAHRGSDAPFWGRTYRFWHPMFFGDLLARWLRYPGDALVAHGTEDLESVPMSSVQSAVPRFAREAKGRIRFVYYEGLGHDFMHERVLYDVDGWIREREAAHTTSDHRSSGMFAPR